MSSNIKRTLIVSAAATVASNWIPLNTNQENFHVGFTIINFGPGIAPTTHVKGTMENTIAETSVNSARIFALVSAPPVSAVGANVVGEITFPAASIRLETISGGSGNTTLEFNVIQCGKI